MSKLFALAPRLNLRKNVTFAVGEFAITMALVFFSYRLVIAQGGLEAVGVWATLFAWVNLIRLGDAGVAGAAARFLALWDIAEQRERIRAHAETALLTNLVQFGLLALLGYAALAPFAGQIVGESYATEAASILPYMMVGFFLLNLSGTVLAVLQGLHLGYRRSQLSVLGTVIQLAIVFALVPVLGLKGLALAQIGQHGVTAIIGWWWARRCLGSGLLPTRFDGPAFRGMLAYSLVAQVLNIANGLFEPVAKMLVGHFGGMATQGLFELAFKTVLLPRNLIGSGVAAMIPAMTALFQENRDALRHLYARAFRVSALAMAGATLALIVLAPIPSTLWLGRVDGNYWLYVVLLAAGYFFNALGMTAYMIGMASGYLRNIIGATLSALACFVALGYLLGSLFGAIGAVGVSAGAIGTLGLIIMFLSKRILDGEGKFTSPIAPDPHTAPLGRRDAGL